MNAPKKLVDFFRRSFSNLSANNSKDEDRSDKTKDAEDSQIKWSYDEDTIVVKKAEFESMQTELYNKTEIIKKLKVKEDSYHTLVEEYEGKLAATIKPNATFHNSLTDIKLNVVERYEDELSRLRSSENRLKSHIQALKRDLMVAEEKAENIEDLYEQKIVHFKNEIDGLKENLRQEKIHTAKIDFENKDLNYCLRKKCEEVAELIEYCRYLCK